MSDIRPVTRPCESCPTCAQAEWSALDSDGARRLTEIRRTKTYDEGDFVFRQDDKANGILCIETGQLLLQRYSFDGQETAFRIVTNGETIGWRSYFAGGSHAASLVALTPCRACLIPKSRFDELLRDYHDLAMAFLRSLARDRGPQEGLLLRSPVLPVRTRLINLLLILAMQLAPKELEDAVCFTLPITRRQIAAMIGIRIETLSRMLASLAQEGVCNVKGRFVTIPDRGRMADEVAFKGRS